MQIKRFEAKSMTAALRLIKAELGPQAVILSARSIRKGSGILGSFKSAGVEVTAATDTYLLKTSGPSFESRQAAYSEPQERGADVQPMDPYKQPASSTKTPDRRLWAQGAYAHAISDGLSDEKKILFSLYQKLVSQDVDPDIANDISESIKLIPDAARRLAQGELKSLLTGLLEHMGVRAEAAVRDHDKPQAVAFVGPTGVGKTTTIAKLAACFALDRGLEVALISFDDLRIAAIDQIKSYASIIGVPLEVATGQSDLKRYLKRFKQKDIILIDTPGFNPKNEERLAEIQAYFFKLNAVEIQLVLSATTKQKDLLDIIKRFEFPGRRRLTFTKLDETNTVGNLLNVLIRTTLPFSYVADGQQVPDAIQGASIEKLVALLCRHDTCSVVWTPAPQSKGVDPNAKGVAPANSMRFVANRNSDVYHILGCKWTNRIKPDHIITFESAEAAARQNYLPCRNCYPDQADLPSPKVFSTGRQKASSRR